MVERVEKPQTNPSLRDVESKTVRDLVALAEAGDLQPVWQALHRILRVAMRNEVGEVLVFDEAKKDIVCYVSSRGAHDALVNAMIDAGIDHEELCNVEAVLGPTQGS